MELPATHHRRRRFVSGVVKEKVASEGLGHLRLGFIILMNYSRKTVLILELEGNGESVPHINCFAVLLTGSELRQTTNHAFCFVVAIGAEGANMVLKAPSLPL